MNDDLIHKYFSNDTSDEEKTQIYQYFSEHPEIFLDAFTEQEWHISIPTPKQQKINEELMEKHFNENSANAKNIEFDRLLRKQFIRNFLFGKNNIIRLDDQVEQTADINSSTLNNSEIGASNIKDSSKQHFIGSNHAEGSITEDNITEDEDFRNEFRSSAKLIARVSTIAASLLLGIIGIHYLFQWNSNRNNKQNLLTSSLSTSVNNIGKAFENINNTSSIQRIELTDHSIVRLYPGSKITYHSLDSFTKRDIVLTGTAIFIVAKDPQRPFTVYCHEVATTAIGTEFKVCTESVAKVSVKLLEGKILVRSTRHNNSNQGKNYYLLAGNSISFNRPLNRFTEINSVEISKITPETEKNPDLHLSKSSAELVSGKATASGTRFEGSRLKDVLDFLANKYQSKIIYPTATVSRIKFIGTVGAKDPLERILGDIAAMNGLQLSIDSSTNTFTLK